MPSPSPARSSPDRARRERIAVVAVSARSLAEAAHRAGFDPVAIDLFGDDDLRTAAAETVVVDGTLEDGPDLDAVVAALAEADRASPLAGVVLGSGFETRPKAVAAIAASWPLLGASAESIRLVKSPTALARFCARSGIPHPELATKRPATDGWLAKTAGAAGGGHVMPLDVGPVDVRPLEPARLDVVNAETTLPFSPRGEGGPQGRMRGMGETVDVARPDLSDKAPSPRPLPGGERETRALCASAFDGGEDARTDHPHPLPFSPQAGRRWPAGPDEGPTLSVVEYSPSSAPSGHLLPQGGEGDGGADVPKGEHASDESAAQTVGAAALALDAAIAFDIADDSIPSGSVYFQRRVAGRAVSACVIGTAEGARVLAFCAQHADPTAEAPFRFGGVAGPVSVPPAVAAEIAWAADAIVAASGLRGLFGIDVILGHGGGWWLLEINPRPTAALDVLDRGAPGLLTLHVAACRGEPVPDWTAPGAAAATSLLYAPSDLAAAPVLPPHCSDRPRPGSPIPAGAPVCTLRAERGDAEEATARVAALKADLHAALFPCDM